MEKKQELSLVERTILIHLLKIRQAQGDTEHDYDRQIRILEQGWSGYYPEVLWCKNTSFELSDDDYKFAADVLAMFMDIGNYVHDHPDDQEVARHSRSRFGGYYQNTESDLLAYTRFLLSDGKSYQIVAKTMLAWDLHQGPLAPIYTRMLQVWRGMTRDGWERDLSHESVMAILEPDA
jgi:uncharacterized protein YfbU (UPF0304 family)